jgi:hypothetical protein
VAAFGVWAYRRDIPLPLVAITVIVPVVAAQRTRQLEPLSFEVSLLAFVTARWSSSLRTAVALGALAAMTPEAEALTRGNVFSRCEGDSNPPFGRRGSASWSRPWFSCGRVTGASVPPRVLG